MKSASWVDISMHTASCEFSAEMGNALPHRGVTDKQFFPHKTN